jgi:hypothetical protein
MSSKITRLVEKKYGIPYTDIEEGHALAYRMMERIFAGNDPDESMPVICAFNPSPAEQDSWRARPVNGHWPKELDGYVLNLYFGLSTLRPAEAVADSGNAKFKNSKQFFHRLHAIMLDDIGVGDGSKRHADVAIDDMGNVSWDEVSWGEGAWEDIPLPPTFIVETSPLNYQFIYVLGTPLKNRKVADHICN